MSRQDTALPAWWSDWDSRLPKSSHGFRRGTLLASGAAASLIALALFLFMLPGHSGLYTEASSNLESTIYNNTLGFGKLLVINVPDRTDHRDALTLSGALTGLEFDWVDGVLGDTVPDKALPTEKGVKLTVAGRGSWRAHINALRMIVEQNLTSAVIFEDDVDWDIRIKDQLRDFALATRALIQPLASNPAQDRYEIFDADFQPEPMAFDKLPVTLQPQLSAYGDDWDVMWLGHCGMRRSRTGLIDDRWSRLAKKTPKGFVVHENDVTVPQTQHIHVYDDPGHPRYREDFANHTRVVSHAMDGICSLVYAVSQAGARRLLYELAVAEFDDYFDIMLREFCDGQKWHPKHKCLTVQPSLFEHHRAAGDMSRDSSATETQGSREHGFTHNIRWSTRLNLAKLVNGETDYDDQLPDAPA